MNWRHSTAYSTLPPAEAGLVAYFQAHVSELCGLKDITARTAGAGWVYAEDEGARELNRCYAGFARPYEEQPLKYQASYDPASHRITMHNLHARPKGKGLGLLYAKTMLGWAHELGVNEIIAERLEDDGITFWPGLGVLPMAPPDGLGELIHKNLTGFRMPEDGRRKFLQIAHTAETNPTLAFRQLGLFYEKGVLLSEANECRQRILKTLCEGKDFIWLPSEASTAALLQPRLGVLPPLRPLDPNGPRRDIIAALQTAASPGPANRL